MHLPVDTVYPIGAGGGTTVVALDGLVMPKEHTGALKGFGLVLVVAGTVTLNISSCGHGS